MEPGTFDRNCLEVSKLMIRLLRHDDTVHREEDGAVRFEDLASMYFDQGMRLPRTGHFEHG